MPRKKRKGESISGYFRTVFAENPQWLANKSNADVIARYNADHPRKPANPRIKANLANIKSVLRSGERKKGRKGGRPPAAAVAVENAAVPTGLDMLEVAIDDCIIMAANLDRRKLDKAIDHLRRARNIVVWKSGQ